MKEVSTRAFGLWFAPLEAKGAQFDRVVAGTGVTVAQLRNRKERVDWSEFVAIMKNMRQVFSDDELIEIGRSYFRAPAMRFAFAIARLTMSPLDFYRWINKPRQGVGNQMFTCVVPTQRELSERDIEVDLTLPDGFEVCREFNIVTIGNFEEMPRLLGAPRAKVRMTPLTNGARYHITVPQGTPILTRARRAVTWPLAVRSAARELKDAHETLRERYDQLVDARAEVERQRGVLDTAYSIGQRIWGGRSLHPIAETVTRSLVELGTIDGARLTLVDSSGTTTAFAGEVGGDADAFAVTLPREPSRGELAVWAHDVDAMPLIELLAPTVALAVDNAIAYRELADYQRTLEATVDKRTAELRTATEELAATVVQLRDAQDVRENFFANISHEIRTPLSLILLATADVERRAGAVLDDRGRTDLTAITDSARKLLRLVDELLLLAAGDATKLAIRPEPTDVAALADGVVGVWRPAADEAGLALAFERPPAVTATVDPVALERILTNLISNAVKFTPRGGAIAIAVSAGERIVIEVHDTGPGIDDELRSRLFGRFERAGGGARRGGSGIGLSLVKQLVEAHGGTVAAIARPTGGTTFRVELPTGAAAPVRAAPATQFRPSDYGARAATPVRSGDVLEPPGESRGVVLVAEDDPRLAELVAHVLAEDFTTIIALDGKAALDLVREYNPHLLVTDIDMPEIDGIELARRFRAYTRDRLAPIVILSAAVDLGSRLAGLEAGAIDYVVKPFDSRELLARVRAQFAMRDLAIRLHRAEQLSSMGTLAAGLAHELRNPANGIVNAIEPLRRLLPGEMLRPERPAGQLFEVMAECAEQIGFLTRQLLGFRNRQGDLELRTVEASEVVQRAVTLASDALRGIDVRERVELSAPVRCAPPLLVQVLTNLVENAGHAAGSGGWVEIAARAEDGRMRFEITDSGPGVPLELRDRVFEPFFTTKPVGTGLGLPLARDIVVRHGGVLEIREREHRAVFVVDLPQALTLPA